MACYGFNWVLFNGGKNSKAVKGAQAVVKFFKKAEKSAMFLESTGGRLLTSAVGGAANFGTFEGVHSITGQYRMNGTVDWGEVAKASGRGLVMGGAIGTGGGLIGNVGETLTQATKSTILKIAVRGTQIVAGTFLEGTIFAIPDWFATKQEYDKRIQDLSDPQSETYEPNEFIRKQEEELLREQQSDDMWDVWTDSMAMMIGFKIHGTIKSVWSRLAEMAKNPGNVRAGIETRMRWMLDGQPKMALTADERAELKKYGYDDLDKLIDDCRAVAGRRRGENAGTPSGNQQIEGGEVPLNRFQELMEDKNVSEAARAKMYWYLTGRRLPASTVINSKVIENRDESGRVVSYTVQSLSREGVVTSRTFTSKRRADVEVESINRQAELNLIDTMEYNYNSKADMLNAIDASTQVAAEKGLPVNYINEVFRKAEAGEALTDYEKQVIADVQARKSQLDGRYSLDGLRDYIMMQAMTDMLDPRLIEFADWVINDFLMTKRDKYNETYRKIYGADIIGRINSHPHIYLKKETSFPSIPFQYRIGGNIAERITSAYIMQHFPNCKTYPMIFTANRAGFNPIK